MRAVKLAGKRKTKAKADSAGASTLEGLPYPWTLTIVECESVPTIVSG